MKLTRFVQLILLYLLAFTSFNVSAIERVTYYHNDSLGSPIAATDKDGNLLWYEEYEPYGERLLKEDGGTNNLWYTGKQEEEAFGINYFGARWYDPSIGRFLAIDKVSFKHDYIQSFNRYTYANNNPYLYVDPDGNFPFLVPVLIFIAKEAAGEAFSHYTGLPAPTVKGLIKEGKKLASNLLAKLKPRKDVANKKDKLFGDARFVGDSKGNIVDLKTTPKGRYIQPSGEKTDILQKHEHPGSGFSHTHIPGTKTTPKDIRPVSAEDVKNIASGKAVLKEKKKK